MKTTRGFPPLASGEPTVLILGTLPSRESIARRQYYGNPRNAFWPIMGRLFGAGPELQYAERCQRLVATGVAVWDVLQASVRPGSLDASIDIESAEANDFNSFLDEFPRIGLVAFNGKKAASLFRRLVVPTLAIPPDDIDYLDLPSTSPAHAAVSFEQKLASWSDIRDLAPPLTNSLEE